MSIISRQFRRDVANAECRLRHAGERLEELSKKRFRTAAEAHEAIKQYWANVWDDRQFLIAAVGTYPGRNPERHTKRPVVEARKATPEEIRKIWETWEPPRFKD
jgi:hypothetical protein